MTTLCLVFYGPKTNEENNQQTIMIMKIIIHLLISPARVAPSLTEQILYSNDAMTAPKVNQS